MKYLKSYSLNGISKNTKLFESSFNEIDTVKDICLEFEDNGCKSQIRKIWNVEDGISSWDHFSIRIEHYKDNYDINKRIQNGLPEWFIETCKRIERFMLDNGFKTSISANCKDIKVNIFDWKDIDTIDDLSKNTRLIKKVRLEFYKTDKMIFSEIKL